MANIKDIKYGYTVIVSGNSENFTNNTVLDTKKLNIEIKQYLKKYSVKDVVKLFSQKNNLSKKKIYDIC